MSSLNKVTGHIIGHLAATPAVTHVGAKNTARAFYTVIRNLRWNDAETAERQERPVMIPLVSWGRQAENDGKYLKKGAHVAVEFRIENARYEKDGEEIHGFQFTVEAIEYLDSREAAERRNAKQAESARH
jgi:single-strand DNA-binding protein